MLKRCRRCKAEKDEDAFSPKERVSRWGRCRDCRHEEYSSADRGHQATVTVACAVCGQRLERRRSLLKGNKTGFFCSWRCRNEVRRRPDQECEECGETYRSKWGGQSRFCSYACHAASMRDRVPVECAGCGAMLKLKRGVVEGSRRHFCSRGCRGKHIHKTGEYVGARSPVWRGGVTCERTAWTGGYEGRKWRLRAKRRADYRCALCGKRGDCRSRVLHVHHILAWAEHPRRRGDPRNARVLCGRCDDGRGHMWLHSAGGKSVRREWEQELLAILRAA